MRYVVYGAGAVGGVIGGQLSRAGLPVTLVARGAHLAAIREGGLRLDSGAGMHRIVAPATDTAAEVDWTHDTAVILAVKSHQAATALAEEGVEAEVLDLRSLRPLDDEAILASVARTHRVVVIDEAWRTGSFAAEVVARIAERALHELAAPPERVCSVEVPIPWAKHLEDATLPSAAAIAAAARGVLGRS